MTEFVVFVGLGLQIVCIGYLVFAVDKLKYKVRILEGRFFTHSMIMHDAVSELNVDVANLAAQSKAPAILSDNAHG